MRLRDQVVVVTGASSGIGRATALAFADRGATVVLAARGAGALEEAAAECRARGAEATALPVDVADAAAVEELAREVVLRHGHIDVWVNAAAVELFAPVDEAPVEHWHRVIETNVLGTFHGLRAALPPMKARRRGVVVNVASVLGRMGVPNQSAYVASKHAVRGLSEVARQELLDLPGISVCTVLPGAVDTPIWRNAANFTGKELAPIKPLIDARRVAATIVRCARRPRREVVVGSSSVLLVLARLAPGLAERFLARGAMCMHETGRTSAPWDGNVLRSLEGRASVSGGWTRAGRQVGADSRRAASNGGASRSRIVAVVAALAAGVALFRRGREH